MSFEDAANLMIDGTLEEQQEASEFMNQCFLDLSCLDSMKQLIHYSTNSNTQFLAACAIYNIVLNRWSEIDQQTRDDIRNTLMSAIFNEDHSDITNSKMISALSLIVFNEWPEQWETMIDDLLQNQTSVENVCKILRILSELASNINLSSNITMMRRTILIQELIGMIPTIIQLIQQYSFDQVVSSIGAQFLAFINPVSLVIDNQPDLSHEIIELIFNNFTMIENLAASAYSCLSNLLIRSKMDSELFLPTVNFILSSIESESAQIQNFLPFICEYMRSSVNLYPEFCYDQEFIPRMRIIFQYTLSMPIDRFLPQLWDFWGEILHLFNEQYDLKTGSIFLIVDPILQYVLNGLYNLLPTAMSSSRLVSFQPKAVFITFSMFNEEMLLNFLLEQQPSTEMCIALGIIKCLNGDELFTQVLNTMIPAIVHDQQISTDAQLFLLSRNCVFLSQNIDYLNLFIQYVSNYITSVQRDQQTSVLLALNHAATYAPDLFGNNIPEFLFQLIQVLNTQTFDRDNFLRMVRIITKIIPTITDLETKNEIILYFVTPISQLLCSNDPYCTKLGCDSVNDITGTASSSTNCQEILKNLFDQLILLLQNSIYDESIFSQVCTCLATVIRMFQWNDIREVFIKFNEIVQSTTGMDEGIVDAYSIIMLKHGKEVSEMRDIIVNQYVKNLVNPPTRGFFTFFLSFGIREEEEPDFINAALSAIRSGDLGLCKSAIEVLLTRFETFKDVPFANPCYDEFIYAIFDALFDQMHHRLIKKLLVLLYRILTAMMKKQIPYDEYIINSIRDRIEDEEFAQSIIASIKSSIHSLDSFNQFMNNFLVAAGRANLSEIQLMSDIMNTRCKSENFKHILTNNSAYKNDEDEYEKAFT